MPSDLTLNVSGIEKILLHCCTAISIYLPIHLSISKQQYISQQTWLSARSYIHFPHCIKGPSVHWICPQFQNTQSYRPASWCHHGIVCFVSNFSVLPLKLRRTLCCFYRGCHNNCLLNLLRCIKPEEGSLKCKNLQTH